jgi:hypothetical protein
LYRRKAVFPVGQCQFVRAGWSESVCERRCHPSVPDRWWGHRSAG